MKINLENIGRRFNREWIFRSVTYQFDTGSSYAILGANGSGKSTLLQIIAGSLTPSEGHIIYNDDHKNIDVENIYQHLALSTPYLELIEEFSLPELVDFHFSFKNYHKGIDRQALTDLLGFAKIRNKPLRHFSSGMKQRVKLALAMCSDTPALLLDEPTANLDKQGVLWYQDLVSRFASDRLLIICSNQEHEYEFCDHRLQVMDYKDFSKINR
ncbi:ATP-binding cassette domain-containing protein [Flavihumibacter sp. R14]|nr:ATP-binding cassette domain-containing protein [Flavihumibacter soli]